MTKCVYCSNEIENNEAPVFVGGDPMHAECQVAYGQDLDRLDAEQAQAEADAWAESEASQYDDDPNPYAGTYSED